MIVLDELLATVGEFQRNFPTEKMNPKAPPGMISKKRGSPFFGFCHEVEGEMCPEVCGPVERLQR